MKEFKKGFILALAGLVALFYILPAVAAGTKVNINTAPKEVLVSLKYVGSTIADRIIEYRSNHRFKAPEDIMNVKGIGQKTFEANKERIIVKSE